jgi:SAM-dependent methyltransferase
MSHTPSHLEEERAHHDRFFEAESGAVFDTPLYKAIDARMCALLAEVGCRAGDRVLSLGSGDGRLENKMAPRVREIVGIELSPVAVAQATNAAASLGVTNATYRTGNIEALELPSASFDAVWAIAVLHHLEPGELERLLRDVFRLLKPGGRFLAIDPSSRRVLGLFRRLVWQSWRRYHSPGEKELNTDRLQDSLRKAGFSCVRKIPSDYFVSPLAWVIHGVPAALVRPAMTLDSALMRLPVIREGASSFCVVSQRP